MGFFTRLLPALLLLAGCATTPLGDIHSFAAQSGHNSFEVVGRSVGAANTLVLPIIHDRQTQGPSCGAHALGSLVHYWLGDGGPTGDEIFAHTPPRAGDGYALSELVELGRSNGLLASAVRMPQAGLIAELERGRPVLVPVRVPAIYIQTRVLPGANTPIIGIAANTIIHRAARLSELADIGMVNHYLLIAGYGDDRFVVVEPILGYRTISFNKLNRYRRDFDNAAIVFSALGGRTIGDGSAPPPADPAQPRGTPSAQQVRLVPGT